MSNTQEDWETVPVSRVVELLQAEAKLAKIRQACLDPWNHTDESGYTFVEAATILRIIEDRPEPAIGGVA